MGSRSPRDDALSQQDASPPALTRSAALPYLSLTTSFESRSAIAGLLISSGLDMCEQKRGSLATPCRPRAVRTRLDRRHGGFDFGDCARLERVIDPAALAPVAQQPGVFQCLQVKRQARL